MFKPFTIFAVATLASASFADAAQAQPEPGVVVIEPGVVSIRVGSADLDLATAAGKHAMRGRVREAARLICEEVSALELSGMMTEQERQRHARQHAEPELAGLFARAARGEKVASLDLKIARSAG